MTASIFAHPEARAALVDSAVRFAEANGPPDTTLRRVEAHPDPADRTLWRAIADLGWLATDVPESRGGLGLEFSLASCVAEALAPALLLEPYASQAAITAHVLASAESDPDGLLARWLDGEAILALAHHESPDAPFYAAPVALACLASDDGFVLTGRKTAVVDGAWADAFLVTAAAENDGEAALFVVPADRPGVEVTPFRALDGRHHADVELRGVDVPRAARLVLQCGVQRVIDEALSRYVLLVASESSGLVQALVARTAAYTEEREQFGHPIARFQVLQHRLADCELAATRVASLVESARTLHDRAGLAAAEATIAAAKVAADDHGRAVAAAAVQTHGAIGMTNEYVVAHFLKRLTANRFATGRTTEHVARFADLTRRSGDDA